ncbi:hypothetical protein BGZ74_002499 [Mortierella antarctica]|nr:hypothetical protein BGZ74_002499 [Mortierella antarctica]
MTQADSSSDQGSNASAFNFTLTSISFSHYNEKTRWGLDYYGIPYTEYRSLPILHMLSMFKSRAKARPTSGTPFVTPHLTVAPANAPDEKDVKITMNDSTEILGFISDRFSAPPNKAATSTSTPPLNLYSNNAETKAKIVALEERFDTIIGPNVRRLVYSEILCHSPKSVGQSLGQHGNAGALQTWIWTWFFFVFSWILIRYFRVTPESAERSKDILKREFEHLSRVLESGPPGPAYLVGNEFTAADMTLASLASLLVGVTQEDGYGAWVPPMSVFRPEAQEFLKELRESTAGQHILECYRLHRGKKAEGSKYGLSFFGWW